MIIVRAGSHSLGRSAEAEAILFYFDGMYFFVESGIVENELRTLKNWETAHDTQQLEGHQVSWNQGTVIPQELGDYLVANQDNNKTANGSDQSKNQADS